MTKETGMAKQKSPVSSTGLLFCLDL